MPPAVGHDDQVATGEGERPPLAVEEDPGAAPFDCVEVGVRARPKRHGPRRRELAAAEDPAPQPERPEHLRQDVLLGPVPWPRRPASHQDE